MKFDDHSLATAFASKILPNPSASLKNTPFEGLISNF
jgi:hypothetical protein